MYDLMAKITIVYQWTKTKDVPCVAKALKETAANVESDSTTNVSLPFIVLISELKY